MWLVTGVEPRDAIINAELASIVTKKAEWCVEDSRRKAEQAIAAARLKAAEAIHAYIDSRTIPLPVPEP